MSEIIQINKNDNLCYWRQVEEVPKEAQKEIKGGRLKGFTDINPMWRLKVLTELFGPCGLGWKYEIVEKKLVPGANNEVAAFVDINLYVKFNGIDGPWSDPIPGTGGSMLVSEEKSGLRTSDECFKMALTDAISVSCKALGVAAKIYWNDESKYSKFISRFEGEQGGSLPQEIKNGDTCSSCARKIAPNVAEYSNRYFGRPLCMDCQNKARISSNQ